MYRDWFVFYKAGKAVLTGISPYSVKDYFNPIQAAWLLAPTTLIPFRIWVLAMIGISFIAIVVLCGKKSHWVLLSLPFIFGMTMGSLDVFLWVPARLFGGVGLSLLTLKPQLAMIFVPFQLLEWWRDKENDELFRFGISTFFLWTIPTIIHPNWITDWLNALPPLESRLPDAASLAGFTVITGGWRYYVAAFVVVMFLLLIIKNNSYYLAASFSPAFWPSDWIIAAEHITWRFVLLSWLLVPTGISENGAQFYFLLGILIWIEKHFEKIKSWCSSLISMGK